MKRPLLFVVLPLLVLSFQNCAPTGAEFEDLEIASEKAFFSYPYKTSPDFYGDILLFQEASDVGTLSEFRFIAMASYIPDADESLVYSIDITDANGDVLCPPEGGTLSSGASSTGFFSCVTGRDASVVKIQMTLSAGGKSTVIEKTYYQ